MKVAVNHSKKEKKDLVNHLRREIIIDIQFLYYENEIIFGFLSNKQRCYFVLTCNILSLFFLQAESLQDMEDWIESIKLYHEAILQAQIISRTSAKSQKTRSFSTQSASMSVAANPIRPRSETDTAVISNSTNSISKRASYTHSIYHTSKLGGVEVVQESETKDEIGGENNVASKSIRTSTRRNSHEIYESLHRLQVRIEFCE